MYDDDKIKQAYRSLFGEELSQEDVERIQLYRIEQGEMAEELFRSAKEDGINFATTDETGDVYVNVRWIGMVVRHVAEGLMVDPNPAPSTMRLAEVLNQTVYAAKKFVGK